MMPDLSVGLRKRLTEAVEGVLACSVNAHDRPDVVEAVVNAALDSLDSFEEAIPVMPVAEHDLNVRNIALTGFWVGALTGSLLLAVVLAILGVLK